MSNSVIQAKTFTCTYVEREDRLLLTINYQDIENRVDFWITRAFLLKLLPYFFEHTTHEQIVCKEQNQLSEKNLSSTDNSTFQLTQKDPILLDSVDFKKIENSLQIIFKNTQNNIFAGAILDEISLNSFVNVLTSNAPKYEWGITSF